MSGLRFTRGSRLAALALVALAFPSHARATIAEALSMGELVQAADHVALVEVIRLEADYDELDRIVTNVSVRVVEPLVGPSSVGDILVVRQIGGVVGDVALRVEGEATFVLGERVILFASDVAGVLRAVGMSQGVLPIARDARGLEMVLPGGAGLSLVRPDDPALLAAPSALAGPREVDEVLGEIRELGADRR